MIVAKYKPIKLVTNDGSIELNKETSEALWVYAEVKKITIEQAVDEILKSLIKLKKENDYGNRNECS